MLLFLYLRRGAAPHAPSEDDLLARPLPPPRAALPAGTPVLGKASSAPAEAPGDEGCTLWQKRLSRAQRTLDSFLEANRYPPTSRPLSEHPDQVKPHFVADQKARLKRRDDKITDARATLHQDRYYLVGDERVAFTITCEDSDGPAPCEALSTLSRAEKVPEGSVPFSPGENGALTATFQPSTQGFAGVHGPIQVFVDLRVKGEEGQVSFEVMYTPSAPAVLTGAVREALSDGSLDLYAEIKVDKPGRYVMAARASDADGRDFAYLSFNEELPAGRQEVRLRLFGKLILDQKARSPFHLRDVEGFLLKENAYPDREIVPALLGSVYVTKRYADRDFADREWQSEDKDRQVKQLTADVEEAKGHVGAGE